MARPHASHLLRLGLRLELALLPVLLRLRGLALPHQAVVLLLRVQPLLSERVRDAIVRPMSGEARELLNVLLLHVGLCVGGSGACKEGKGKRRGENRRGGAGGMRVG